MFKSKRPDPNPQPPPRPSGEQPPSRPPGDLLVTTFLRGQNLEQMGRIEEATKLYEEVVESGFDAAGPYDRLIFIYQQARMHTDVIRIAGASIQQVRTYPQKIDWYRKQIADAQAAMTSPPSAL